MIFRFTHTIAMEWMLPGLAPTGKRVEVPLVAIVHFRDGKLAHEHIYWDQASVLVQLGLLSPSGLPVAGVETARKVLDPGLPSNELIRRAERSRVNRQNRSDRWSRHSCLPGRQECLSHPHRAERDGCRAN